jgi:hypothetical protein
MKTLTCVLIFFLTGCAIADRSDKFGADLDIGIGGILSYVVDLRLKASVGFSKTCGGKDEKLPDGSPADDWGFLQRWLHLSSTC